MMYYKLGKDKSIIPCGIEEWLKRYGEDEKASRVAWAEIDDYQISTVFLGLDHGHGLTKRPLLFETMIFGKGRGDGYQTRCSTWDEALEMHKKAITYVIEGCPNMD
jgi:hypothetical protein